MSGNTQIICGVDPGLRQTGYGVILIDDEEDSVRVLDAGVVRCSRSEALSLRLAELASGFSEVLDDHRVELVAVEEIYSHCSRPRTAILMAHARGVILLEAAQRDIRVIHLPATSVKRHITGNGRATKDQMQRAVADLLKLNRIPEPPDVADALAIALCAACVIRQPARLALTDNDQLLSH
ncbi:MAG: crossover junction endodeoxyribonuclease RuvC [Phycisphaerae bacterium]|nr:crossover junction endodeoxyribonuclease RuvC [Phycisphaerae bacterium]